jgi:hypothetical protein
MAVFGSNAIPVKIPKTACLTGCSHKSPSAQTDQTGLSGGQPTTQRWKHRAIGCSVALDRLTSAGEQLKSSSASHLVVREDNCGMTVRRTEWAIIGCRLFPQLRGDTLYPANHVSIKLLGRSARSAKTIKTCRRNVYYRFALKEKKTPTALQVLVFPVSLHSGYRRETSCFVYGGVVAPFSQPT